MLLRLAFWSVESVFKGSVKEGNEKKKDTVFLGTFALDFFFLMKGNTIGFSLSNLINEEKQKLTSEEGFFGY